MKKGVMVRQLLLPGQLQDAKNIINYLYEAYGNQIYVSIMNQYTPMPKMQSHPLLSRKVTEKEYANVVQYANQIGIENAYTQEGEAATESFIPEFSDRPQSH